MKRILVITSLLVAALATGCKPSAEKPSTETTGTAAQKLDQVQAATENAAQQMRDYTYAQKDEFVATMQTRLAELNQSLNELSANVEKAGDAVKTEAAPRIAALRDQAKQLQAKLAEVAQAEPSTWDGIKADSEKAYASLKDGFNQARQWASEKIAP